MFIINLSRDIIRNCDLDIWVRDLYMEEYWLDVKKWIFVFICFILCLEFM